MRCEACGTRSATRVVTRIVDGKKHIFYRCDSCGVEPEKPPAPPKLARPCAQCRKREGRIKLARLRENYRTVVYLCEVCAKRPERKT